MPPVLVSGGKLSARLMVDGTGGAGFQRLLLIFSALIPANRICAFRPGGSGTSKKVRSYTHRSYSTR